MKKVTPRKVSERPARPLSEREQAQVVGGRDYQKEPTSVETPNL